MTDHSDEKTSRDPVSRSWWAATRSRPAFWVIVVAALAVGFLLRGGSDAPSGGAVSGVEGQAVATTWICSMHPQVQLPEPGQCPICFMDLIPLTRGGGDEDEGPRVIAMSETAKKIARIVTAPVERRYAQAVVRMVGKVDYDETRLAYIPALVPGELARLFVDYTGIEVQEGDHMVVIDSPGLLAAQEELLQAVATARKMRNSKLGTIRETAEATVDASRQKLRRWGLNAGQIAEIEERGTASDEVTLYAPIGGVVIEKNALEGTYVHIGTPIYTIADLSVLWVKLEAYESDLPWLRYGQRVTFTTAALAGEEFTGTVTFIDPILDAATRTVKVRVNVPNPRRKLKPGMFVRATVTAEVAASGRVMDASLSGKWICPMHPEVVENQAGDCEVCGMPLKTAESLGYTKVTRENSEPPLIIPASAPLITGKRAVVYVELPDRDRPTYEGREVILGPRAGDFYLVESGLEEGERVVVNGAFKIDSELQIRAGPSMMSPEGGAAPTHHHGGEHADAGTGSAKRTKAVAPPRSERRSHVPDAFTSELGSVFAAYFELQNALAADKMPDAQAAMQSLSTAAGHADATGLDDATRAAWHELHGRLAEAAAAGVEADDWTSLRTQFETISLAVIDADYQFGHPASGKHRVTFCPMAFNSAGAYWLQKTDAIANPYFGRSMLKCGKVTDRIAAAGDH